MNAFRGTNKRQEKTARDYPWGLPIAWQGDPFTPKTVLVQGTMHNYPGPPRITFWQEREKGSRTIRSSRYGRTELHSWDSSGRPPIKGRSITKNLAHGDTNSFEVPSMHARFTHLLRHLWRAPLTYYCSTAAVEQTALKVAA